MLCNGSISQPLWPEYLSYHHFFQRVEAIQFNRFFVRFKDREPVRAAINAVAKEYGALPGETILRIMQMTVWRPDWGRASGVSTAWYRAIANDVCYRTMRQLWIEEHDVELQSTMRLIGAEDRRKRTELREGRPDSSDSDWESWPGSASVRTPGQRERSSTNCGIKDAVRLQCCLYCLMLPAGMPVRATAVAVLLQTRITLFINAPVQAVLEPNVTEGSEMLLSCTHRMSALVRARRWCETAWWKKKKGLLSLDSEGREDWQLDWFVHTSCMDSL